MIGLAHAGAVGRPDGEGRAGGGACGDRVRITLGLAAAGRICEARFGADACAAATAAAAWLAAAVEGRDLLAAALLGDGDVIAGAAIPPAGARCAAVAVDALHAAIGDAVRRGARLDAAPGRVVVAMSGGVDSAVALAEAHAAGLDPVGCTLRLWIDPAAPDPERACCAPASVRTARATCHAHGVPHLALDLAEAFRERVVEPFVAAYAEGSTPNPCVRCNGAFRLDALVGVAAQVGAGALWTGHYARVVERAGVPLVARGADPAKDQSYMLARVAPGVVERLCFPLGGRTKVETRARARALGLAAAEAAESQEVCFLGGARVRDFLRRHGVADRPGAIEDEQGVVVGVHDGFAGLTPGQRRGVGAGGGEAPRYVLRVVPERDAVVVASRERLATARVALADAVLHVPRRRVDAKLRYRSPATPATLEGATPALVLHLDAPSLAPAPGQTAALYDGDAVVGAGTIAAG